MRNLVTYHLVVISCENSNFEGLLGNKVVDGPSGGGTLAQN